MNRAPRRPGHHARRAAGLLLGITADTMWGDPARWHPVAGIGRAAARAEQLLYDDDRAAGAQMTALVIIPAVATAWWLERQAATHSPVSHVALIAATTWAACGAQQLGQIGLAVHAALDAGDLDEARRLMPWLVGRDPSTLEAGDMARAAVESVAENTADAAIGPIVWLVLAGVPGVVAHRAVNTLDAMIGHRSPRYARFGTVAARSDDVLGYVPARLTAVLTAIVAPLVGGRPAAAIRAWRRDASRHPSPNAGPVEAAAAGALGRTLGGPVTYEGRTEQRGPLGTGPAPDHRDIVRMVTISHAVVRLSAAVGALGLIGRHLHLQHLAVCASAADTVGSQVRTMKRFA